MNRTVAFTLRRESAASGVVVSGIARPGTEATMHPPTDACPQCGHSIVDHYSAAEGSTESPRRRYTCQKDACTCTFVADEPAAGGV